MTVKPQSSYHGIASEHQSLLLQSDDYRASQHDTSEHEQSVLQPGGIESEEELERSLLWKLDLRMTMLIVIYILNHIDRSSTA